QHLMNSGPHPAGVGPLSFSTGSSPNPKSLLHFRQPWRAGYMTNDEELLPEIKLGALRAQSLVFHSTQAGCHSGTAAAETDEACR
ncbi:putative cleavage and polyadenylation specificity factor subunit 1, partial [Dissostichus eleginoides]